MTEPVDFEALLRKAFTPVDPPAGLPERVEERLTILNELAWDELESWELQALRDPRNWTRLARPIAAGVVATGAGGALVLLRARRDAKSRGTLRRLLRR